MSYTLQSANPLRKRARVPDTLPEDQSYVDNGCEASASCLECPLPQCKFDDPAWYRAYCRRGRDLEFLSAQQLEGLSVFEIAYRYGVSPRTVHRGIRRVENSAEAAVVA